ncbi:hypothetical protein [Archangium violaceum]|uniref:hypothetical protein n=1 Tax=Archangium violaceum TaxID=83451 RepID=UPI0012698F8A|nr:hypothetical protein [Archangium violaceum]
MGSKKGEAALNGQLPDLVLGVTQRGTLSETMQDQSGDLGATAQPVAQYENQTRFSSMVGP